MGEFEVCIAVFLRLDGGLFSDCHLSLSLCQAQFQ